MARRRRRQAASRGVGPIAMYVIAGLPPEVHGEVIARLRARFPERSFVGTPSRGQDGPLYPADLVEKLVQEISSFAVRRRAGAGARPASPKSITLAYVPSRDDERLLTALDFAVMSARVDALAAYGEKGRQLRHYSDAALAALIEALGPTSPAKVALDEVVQRLQRLSDREAILLPPENFHVGEGRLRTLFLEFRRRERPAQDRFAELEPVRLTGDDIPWLGSDIRHCHVDRRGIAFLNAHPTAYDGAHWEKDEGADGSVLMPALRSLYRFGGALPSGFHHDAQRSDGKDLQEVQFDCSRKGTVTLSAPYANIYPDDFVRPGKRRR